VKLQGSPSERIEAYLLGYVEDLSRRERSLGIDASQGFGSWAGEKVGFSATD